MQRYHAMVAIEGQRHQVVHKINLSAAEIQILNTIHGPGSVTQIKTMGGNDKTPYRQELEALSFQYGRARVGEDRRPVCAALFNIHSPESSMPKTVQDLDLPEAMLHEDDRKKKSGGGKAGGSKTASKPADTTETEQDEAGSNDADLME